MAEQNRPLYGKPCRHCGHKKINRPRGLCWTCWHDTDIRDQYPPGSADTRTAYFSLRGLGNVTVARRPPAAPTAARVGTLARLREYRRRLVAGEHLFHPADAREVGTPAELAAAQLVCRLAELAAAPDPLAA